MKKRFYVIISIMLLLSFAFSINARAVSVTDFTDVKSTDWHYNAVDYAATNNLFKGTSATTFSPNSTMTRGMFITVLGRLAGVSDTYGRAQSTPFSDVTQADYFFPYTAWAKDYGIVEGVDGKLNPHTDISREDMTTYMYRYAGKGFYNLTFSAEKYNTFPDTNSVSGYAVTAMQWATAHGVINGSDGRLNPQGSATRAQVAQIFLNFSQLETNEPSEPDESDPPDWENYNPTYTVPTGKSAADANGGYYDYDLANEIMAQVNALRVEKGLAALLYQPKIQEWAGVRAQEIIISFSHTRPDGTNCLTVGQGLCFENLLRADDYTESWKMDIQGYTKDVITSWNNSDSHRLSMLSSAANLGSIACYVKGNNVYIAHLFSMKTLYYMDYLI